MILSGGDWYPPDDPDWAPPVEYVLAVTGTRPSAVELADMCIYWLALFAAVDEIRHEAEKAAHQQGRW